jgi:hypothetical protein
MLFFLDRGLEIMNATGADGNFRVYEVVGIGSPASRW